MKGGNINRFLPYEADYELLAKCRNWETIGLWGIGICSILLPVFSHYSNITILNILWNIINPLYFLLIISYYILNVYTETFLYPATARKRRKGFIDNSLGSKFLEKSVISILEPYGNDIKLLHLFVDETETILASSDSIKTSKVAEPIVITSNIKIYLLMYQILL